MNKSISHKTVSVRL